MAREALAVGSRAMRLYAHKFSPKTYTQPQLFACLVLKTFFKVDYCGVCTFLRDLSDLRRTLGLRSVPHFTTFQKASQRLLRAPRVRRPLAAEKVGKPCRISGRIFCQMKGVSIWGW